MLDLRVKDCVHCRVAINRFIINTKAQALRKLFNWRVEEKKHFKVTFSGGWLSAFKKRWGQRTFCSHDESGYCDVGAGAFKVLKVFEKVNTYAVQETFNAYELGLNYRIVHTKTIGVKRTSGQNFSKERFLC